MKYIDTERLKTEIKNIISTVKNRNYPDPFGTLEQCLAAAEINALELALETIDSLQQEQPANMIQWTGSNLQEVIDFTGKSPKFGEWFKTWDEFESYVHSHGDILKLFSEDGSHFEVPVGAWIVKTPDGYNVPSVARFIHAKQEQPEVDFEKAYESYMESSKDDLSGSAVTVNMKDLARHFYELGLKARKEE